MGAMPANDTVDSTADPAEVERYARAAAGAAGLQVDDAWWPGVVRSLGGLLARAASLEGAEIPLPEDPAPVFEP
jgi:hypothetical protein